MIQNNYFYLIENKQQFFKSAKIKKIDAFLDIFLHLEKLESFDMLKLCLGIDTRIGSKDLADKDCHPTRMLSLKEGRIIESALSLYRTTIKFHKQKNPRMQLTTIVRATNPTIHKILWHNRREYLTPILGLLIVDNI